MDSALARSDSALSLGMIKVILDEGLQKDDFLKAHTTAPCLIDKTTGVSFLAKDDDETSYQVIDSKTNQIVAHDASGVDPLLTTEGTDFADKYVTEFDLVKAEAAKWDADAVKAETDVDFDDYARIARDYAKSEARHDHSKHGRLPAHRERIVCNGDSVLYGAHLRPRGSRGRRRTRCDRLCLTREVWFGIRSKPRRQTQ